LSNVRWFHGKISREMAEDLLTPKENGLFLVRESTNYPGDYTLCVCYVGKVEHYRVKYKDNQLTIDDEEFFENLSQLVEVSHFLIYFLNFLYLIFLSHIHSHRIFIFDKLEMHI